MGILNTKQEATRMVAMTSERLLTVPEVAERLRVSRWTVLNWLRDGKLRGRRLGGTRLGWRVLETDLERFIAGDEPRGSD